MHADTSDYFIEDCRPGGATGWQYRRGERWFDFQHRQEVIRRKGDEPIILDVYENEQGILSRTPDRPKGRGKYLSVAWIGEQADGGRAIGTWLDVIAAPQHGRGDGTRPRLPASVARVGVRRLARATSACKPAAGCRSAAAATRASCRSPPGTRKITGRAGCASICCRANTTRRSASSPAPTKSSIAATDRRCTPTRQPDYRKRRIVERLTELPRATVEDMQNLQYDVLSLQARDLLPVLLALVDDCPLKEKLSAWDCRYTPASTEATLFQHFYRHVVLQIFGNEQGIGWRRMFYLCTRMGYSTMVLTAIDRTLRKVTSSWWRGRSKKALVQQAAELAQHEPVDAVVGVQLVPLREPVLRQRPRAAGCSASARGRSPCPAATPRRFKAIS